MGTIWISNDAQTILDQIKKGMAEEGMGKPSYTDAVMRLSKTAKPRTLKG